MKKILTILLISPSFLQHSHAQSIAITEIMYNSDSSIQSKSWLELYNFGSSAVDLSNWKLRDETAINVFTIPASTNISAGGYLVLAQWMDTFSMVYPAVTNVVGDFQFGLDNTSGSVRIYDATDVLVKSVNYVDSLPWPNAADGLGGSLQIDDYTADANDPGNWFAGCVGGSPGTDYAPCDYDIVVSEINYHSADDFNMKNWIELWNHTNTPISISNWVFRDNNMNNSFVIPAGTTLEANERLVICDSMPAMNALWPFVTNIIGEFNFGLSNNGDGVRLYNNEGILQYSVRYDDALPWPLDADGFGYSLELDGVNNNPNLAASWFAGCPHGSPGAAFSLPCGVAVEEITNETHITASPNPFSETIYFALDEQLIQTAVEISVVNLLGEKIISFFPTNSICWNGNNFDGNEVAVGMYLLSVIMQNGTPISEAFIKQ